MARVPCPVTREERSRSADRRRLKWRVVFNTEVAEGTEKIGRREHRLKSVPPRAVRTPSLVFL